MKTLCTAAGVQHLVNYVLSLKSSLVAVAVRGALWPSDPRITNVTCGPELDCSQGGLLILPLCQACQESRLSPGG